MAQGDPKRQQWLRAMSVVDELNKGGIFCKATRDGEIVSLDPSFDIGYVYDGGRLPLGFYVLPEYDRIRTKVKETKKHPLVIVVHHAKGKGIVGQEQETIAVLPLKILTKLLEGGHA